jgi:pimeloyl-ACP methyl ester carboxylesterase
MLNRAGLLQKNLSSCTLGFLSAAYTLTFALSGCGAMPTVSDAAVADRPQPNADVPSTMDQDAAPDAMLPMDVPSALIDVGNNGQDVPSAMMDVPNAMAVSLTSDGPLMAMALAPRMSTMPASTGCAGNDCRVTLQVTVPVGSTMGRGAPFPVIVFSNGFQLPSSQYATYATRAARWGYVVVRWDTTGEGGLIPRSISHRVLANMLREIPTDVSRAPETMALVDATKVVFAGHSRGGKLSVLAAAGNANALAVVGLDPVDAPPPMTPAGPEYPSAVAALAMVRGSSVFVGSALGAVPAPLALGMACAPAASNYTTFYNAAMAPSTEVVLAQTGHMQFVDDQRTCPVSVLGSICAICTAGTTPDARVRELSQVLLIAAAERATRGADMSAYLSVDGAWLAAQRPTATARAR